MTTDAELPIRIVEAVANRAGADAMSLPPLYDAIDPEALELVLARDSPDPITVQFTYLGYRVTVESGDEPAISIESQEPEVVGRNGCESLP